MQYDYLNIFAIILEPIAYLTRVHLRATSSIRRVRRVRQESPTPLCDLVDEKFSPVTLFWECYSMVLAGTAPRLVLLVGRQWCDFND